jgi:hypothetical protein
VLCSRWLSSWLLPEFWQQFPPTQREVRLRDSPAQGYPLLHTVCQVCVRCVRKHIPRQRSFVSRSSPLCLSH